jgi:hypothetical protein
MKEKKDIIRRYRRKQKLIFIILPPYSQKLQQKSETHRRGREEIDTHPLLCIRPMVTSFQEGKQTPACEKQSADRSQTPLTQLALREAKKFALR